MPNSASATSSVPKRLIDLKVIRGASRIVVIAVRFLGSMARYCIQIGSILLTVGYSITCTMIIPGKVDGQYRHKCGIPELITEKSPSG